MRQLQAEMLGEPDGLEFPDRHHPAYSAFIYFVSVIGACGLFKKPDVYTMNSEISSPQDPTSLPPLAQARGIKKYMTVGTILPAIFVTGLVVVALVTITGIVRKAIDNKGLMPRPASLSTYACSGFAVPMQIAYRHGKNSVQLYTSNATLRGTFLNGKINWEQPVNGSEALGFVPPTEIVYDDAKIIRLIDDAGKTQVCNR